MKKNYHYLYALDDLDSGYPELYELYSCFTEEDKAFGDVIRYLDQQNFDIRNSVVRKLVEYAGRECSNRST